MLDERARLEGWAEGHGLTRDDILIVAGDLGLPWDFSDGDEDEIALIESRLWTTVLADGSHERRGVRLRRDEHLHDGSGRVGRQRHVHAVRRLVAVGAADECNFEEAESTLEARNWRVDAVVTHCCLTRMLPTALFPMSTYQRSVPDRLTEHLDTFETRLTFNHWYCGYCHVDHDLDDRRTVLYDRIVLLGRGVDR